MWVESNPGTAEGWYFLLPNVIVCPSDGDYSCPKGGIAIRLKHGVSIAWDGQVIRHGTTVHTPGLNADGSQNICGSVFSAGTTHALTNKED